MRPPAHESRNRPTPSSGAMSHTRHQARASSSVATGELWPVRGIQRHDPTRMVDVPPILAAAVRDLTEHRRAQADSPTSAVASQARRQQWRRWRRRGLTPTPRPPRLMTDLGSGHSRRPADRTSRPWRQDRAQSHFSTRAHGPAGHHRPMKTPAPRTFRQAIFRARRSVTGTGFIVVNSSEAPPIALCPRSSARSMPTRHPRPIRRRSHPAPSSRCPPPRPRPSTS